MFPSHTTKRVVWLPRDKNIVLQLSAVREKWRNVVVCRFICAVKLVLRVMTTLIYSPNSGNTNLRLEMWLSNNGTLWWEQLSQLLCLKTVYINSLKPKSQFLRDCWSVSPFVLVWAPSCGSWPHSSYFKVDTCSGELMYSLWGTGWNLK
jgi:hypothetical protein